MTIRPIDTFRFDGSGRIAQMRASSGRAASAPVDPEGCGPASTPSLHHALEMENRTQVLGTYTGCFQGGGTGVRREAPAALAGAVAVAPPRPSGRCGWAPRRASPGPCRPPESHESSAPFTFPPTDCCAASPCSSSRAAGARPPRRCAEELPGAGDQRYERRLAEAAAAIRAETGLADVHSQPCDVSREDQVRSLMAFAEERLGGYRRADQQCRPGAPAAASSRWPTTSGTRSSPSRSPAPSRMDSAGLKVRSRVGAASSSTTPGAGLACAGRTGALAPPPRLA